MKGKMCLSREHVFLKKEQNPAIFEETKINMCLYDQGNLWNFSVQKLTKSGNI